MIVGPFSEYYAGIGSVVGGGLALGSVPAGLWALALGRQFPQVVEPPTSAALWAEALLWQRSPWSRFLERKMPIMSRRFVTGFAVSATVVVLAMTTALNLLDASQAIVAPIATVVVGAIGIGAGWIYDRSRPVGSRQQ